jgi:hypothetical protein
MLYCCTITTTTTTKTKNNNPVVKELILSIKLINNKLYTE